MKSIVCFTLLLVLLLTACTSKRGGSEFQHNLSHINLHENLSVSTDSLNTVIGRVIRGLMIRGIAVDSRGNIYLVDYTQAKIQVVSPDGRYLESIGQRGRGPGEFEHISGVYIYNNILYVLEYGPDRLSEFRLGNYQLLGTVPFPDIHVGNQPIGVPKVIYPLSNGRYEVVFRNIRLGAPDPKVTISILNHDLEPVDTRVHQFLRGHRFLYRSSRGLTVWPRLSLIKTTLVTIGPHGYVYETKADSMHIRVFDSNGKKIRNISAKYIPPRLTDKDLDSLASRMSPIRRNMFYKALNQNKLPDHWPALQDLLVDDQGRCWVELANHRKKKQTWWIFDTDGNPKWRFQLSSNVKLYVVRNHEAYGIWNKNGDQRIVRYHVEGM